MLRVMYWYDNKLLVLKAKTLVIYRCFLLFVFVMKFSSGTSSKPFFKKMQIQNSLNHLNDDMKNILAQI